MMVMISAASATGREAPIAVSRSTTTTLPLIPGGRHHLVGEMLGDRQPEKLPNGARQCPARSTSAPFDRQRHIGQQLRRQRGKQPQRPCVRDQLGEFLDVAPVQDGNDDCGRQQQPEKPRPPVVQDLRRLACIVFRA